VNTAVGSRFAGARLVRNSVDVNVTRVRIHIAALIQAWLKPFQPENARGDFGVGKLRLRRVADGFTRFEDSTRGRARTDLFGDAM